MARLLTILLGVAVVLSLSTTIFDAPYSGGSGTEADPYQIATVADWQELATSADWDKSFILTADLDLAGVALTPVGTEGNPFVGVVDGNGHIIRNAVIYQPNREFVGLFGYLGSGGQIKNLGVENVDIQGLEHVGGLVGDNYQGTITSCYATGTVSGANSQSAGFVGGLVGCNHSTITASYATGSVSGGRRASGLDSGLWLDYILLRHGRRKLQLR
jgi:hypothetical protein